MEPEALHKAPAGLPFREGERGICGLPVLRRRRVQSRTWHGVSDSGVVTRHDAVMGSLPFER